MPTSTADIVKGQEVKMLFDYDYEDTDGQRRVAVKTGDEFFIINKIPGDWCLVQPQSESRAIYVPASYVQPIYRTHLTISEDKLDIVSSTDLNTRRNAPQVARKPDTEDVENAVMNAFDRMLDIEESKPFHFSVVDTQDVLIASDDEQLTPPPATTTTTSATTPPPPPAAFSDSEPDSPLSLVTPPRAEEGEEDESGDVVGAITLRRKAFGLNKNFNEIRKSFDTQLLRQNSNDVDADKNKRQRAMSQICTGTGQSVVNRAVSLDRQLSSIEIRPPKLNRSPTSVRTVPLPIGWNERINVTTNEITYTNRINADEWQIAYDNSGNPYYHELHTGDTAWDLPYLTEHHENTFATDSPTPSAHSSSSMNTDRSSRPQTPEPLGTRSKEIAGFLFKTKIIENKKKTKKNWARSYVKVSQDKVFTYKDVKSAQPVPSHPTGKPEIEIELVNAQVTLGAKQHTKKKNVLLLCTHKGCNQYLFHSEHEIQEWYDIIKYNLDIMAKRLKNQHNAIDTTSSSSSSSPSILRVISSPIMENTPPSTINRFVQPHDADYKPQRNTNSHNSYILDKTPPSLRRSIMERPYSKVGSNGEGRQKKDWLSNFFRKRPPMETLRQKGIMKDVIFGSSLSYISVFEGRLVPRFVTESIRAIECRGLDSAGIYRISGNVTDIQKLKFCVMSDDDFDLEKSNYDLNVITGALKMFFRDLQEPLFPFNVYTECIHIIRKENKQTKINQFRKIVIIIPETNKETMKVLFSHLLRVVEYSHENKMRVESLATIFGPTLLLSSDPASDHNATFVILQARIVEFFLQNFRDIF